MRPVRRASAIASAGGIAALAPAADAALPAGLDAAAVGDEDCVQGARGRDIP